MWRYYYPNVFVFAICVQVLCGCGALDGTEISEAVSVAIHCSQKGFKPKFYAPDIEICDIVDHYCKKTSDESRNALSEAARIARSSIKPLCECDSSSGEALIIPGGFGVAKTLLVYIYKINLNFKQIKGTGVKPPKYI